MTHADTRETTTAMRDASVDALHDDATASSGAVQRERVALLVSVVEPVVRAMGYELAHLEWNAAGRTHRLQVFIDHPDGIDLDDCARLSPIISNALDAAEANEPAVARLLAGRYALEVSSPGLDRPLSRRSHFARFVGHRAKIRTFAPLTPDSDQRNFHGRIEQVEPDPDRPDDEAEGTVVIIDPDGGAQHRIPLTQIRRANLVYQIGDEG